ncbi:MAG: cytochrome c [Candidatus Eremiobacteraeota bacterium]|nr:cytochrome c [Candidatus Eremiobacteraeota bacterium]
MQSKPFAFLAAGALAASILAGCSKGSDQSSSSTTTTTTQSSPVASSATSAMTAAAGDAAHGKAIFTANCATCHGQTGTEGGIGPPLKNEKSRKNYAQTVAWIKNPQPPMAKLYPSPLNEKDVEDVAAYVQSL